MLRTRHIVAALLAVTLSAVAIGQEPRNFTLSFKNKEGKLAPFYQEMTTEVTQHIKVQGQDLPQQQKSTFWYQWTPVEEKKVMEGKEEITKLILKQKIEGLKINIDISGNPINYDSRTPDQPGSAGNPGLVEFFKHLKDAEFTVTLGKNYKVEKVDGKEEFIKKLGSGSSQMDALLKKVMTEDALKEMVDPTYKLFPDTPKKPGEKWERNTKLNLGPIGSYDLTYKFTYVGPETAEGPKKGLDKIEVETVVTYIAPKETTEGLLFRIKEGSTLTSDPAGSKGTVYYDPKAGRIDEATIRIKLKGNLKVVIGGTDTAVELIQEQTTTIKGSDTSLMNPPKKEEPPKK